MTVEQLRNITSLLADPDGVEKIREQFSPQIVRQLVEAGLIPRKVRRPRRWYRTPKSEVVRALRENGFEAARRQFDPPLVAAVARELGLLRPDENRRNVWRDEWNALLGTKHDADLAVELGVSRGLVSIRRNRAGVAACEFAPSIRRYKPQRTTARQRAAQIPDEILAASSVRDLVQRYDVYPATVSRERNRRSLTLRPIRQRLILGAREDRGQTMTRAMVAGAAAAGCSLVEIGERLGFSRERARQVLEQALSEFQVVLADKEQVVLADKESEDGTVGGSVEHEMKEPAEIDKIQPGVQGVRS